MTPRSEKYWRSGEIPLIAPDILGDIISTISDVAVVMTSDGIVKSVLTNPNADAFQRLESLEASDFRTSLSRETLPKFDIRLKAFVSTGAAVRPVEVNHPLDGSQDVLPVRYSFHKIGPGDLVLILGRDLRPVAEMQQQLVKAQLALERDYQEQREFETRFRVLMESAADVVVFISMQTGRITDANEKAQALMCKARDQLIGSTFGELLATQSAETIMGLLSERALSGDERPINATIRRNKVKVELFPSTFRAAGERILLCRITPSDDLKLGQDSLSTQLHGLYQTGPEAIVFTDAAGEILAANDGFVNLISASEESQVRGQSIADFMQRGSIDFNIMTENASRSSRMRSYATRVAGEYGSPRPVDISITALDDSGQNVFAFVMRETMRNETARSDTSDEGIQAVVELVGSATLRQIVAETTDVVEKLCIETAVELTQNNRVAAAEMLGLSRQSLYVKLRKFGLLARDGDD